MNLDKIKYRGGIRYLQKKGSAPWIIQVTLKNNTPALSSAKKWASEFKRGRESFENEPRSGRSFTVTTQENIDYIYQMVMDDRRLTLDSWLKAH